MTHNLVSELRVECRRALIKIWEWKFPAAELKPQLTGHKGNQLIIQQAGEANPCLTWL